MTRAAGKHGPRNPALTPEQARELGIPTTGTIPGGTTHLVNPVLPPPTKPGVPAKRDEFREDMAHGVPPDEYHHDREAPDGSPRGAYKPTYAKTEPSPIPVPVYIVEAGGRRQRKQATVRRVQIPAAGGEPVRVGGDDRTLIAVKLLNEGVTNATGVRFAHDIASLSGTNAGALLPNSMTSYLKIETQSDLWLISDDSNTPYVSVVIEFEQEV